MYISYSSEVTGYLKFYTVQLTFKRRVLQPGFLVPPPQYIAKYLMKYLKYVLSWQQTGVSACKTY